MKPYIITTALCLFLGQAAISEESHDHADCKKEAGPNGGRIITSTEPHFEFFVTPERNLQITFIEEDHKAVALTSQSISAVGGERSAPTKFTFSKIGESLISDVALSKGMLVPLILTVKLSDAAKPVLVKFKVNMANCSECDLTEYACICEH